MRKKIVCLLTLAMTLFSCSSLPKVSDSRSTLLIGRIIFLAENYDEIDSLNGFHENGLSMILTELEKGRHMVLEADENGYVYTTNIKPGTYKFVRFVLRYHDKEYAIDVDEKLYEFEIEEDRVNNFGMVSCVIDAQTGNDYGGTVGQNEVLLELKNKHQGSRLWSESTHIVQMEVPGRKNTVKIKALSPENQSKMIEK